MSNKVFDKIEINGVTYEANAYSKAEADTKLNGKVAKTDLDGTTVKYGTDGKMHVIKVNADGIRDAVEETLNGVVASSTSEYTTTLPKISTKDKRFYISKTKEYIDLAGMGIAQNFHLEFDQEKSSMETLVNLKDLGCNCVRYMIDLASVINLDTSEINNDFISELSYLCDRCDKAGLYIFIDIHSYNKTLHFKVDSSYMITSSGINKNEEFCLAWKSVANALKNKTNVAGYSLMNEPAGKILTDVSDESFSALMSNYNLFLQNLVNAIRTVDTSTLIVVQPLNGIYNKNNSWVSTYSIENKVPTTLASDTSIVLDCRHTYPPLTEIPYGSKWDGTYGLAGCTIPEDQKSLGVDKYATKGNVITRENVGEILEAEVYASPSQLWPQNTYTHARNTSLYLQKNAAFALSERNTAFVTLLNYCISYYDAENDTTKILLDTRNITSKYVRLSMDPTLDKKIDLLDSGDLYFKNSAIYIKNKNDKLIVKCWYKVDVSDDYVFAEGSNVMVAIKTKAYEDSEVITPIYKTSINDYYTTYDDLHSICESFNSPFCMFEYCPSPSNIGAIGEEGYPEDLIELNENAIMSKVKNYHITRFWHRMTEYPSDNGYGYYINDGSKQARPRNRRPEFIKRMKAFLKGGN